MNHVWRGTMQGNSFMCWTEPLSCMKAPCLTLRISVLTKSGFTETISPLKKHGDASTILNALRAHQYNKGKTAEALGISRTTLWEKMKRHSLD